MGCFKNFDDAYLLMDHKFNTKSATEGTGGDWSCPLTNNSR